MSYGLDLANTLKKANTIIDEARTVIADRLERGFTFKKKIDKTLVTDVDLEVEQRIRTRLEEAFPEHGILGEEYAASRPGSSLMWIIDPIDGTHRFRHRVPLYGTILALYDQSTAGKPVEGKFRWAKSVGTPLVAIIDIPEIDRRASAYQGGGAYLNGKRCTINDLESPEELEDEIIATSRSGQYFNNRNQPLYQYLIQNHPNVMGYPDCFGHLLAASGSFGAMIEINLALWDFVSTPLLVTEAGGKFVCFEEYLGADGSMKFSAVFGKPKVVDWILEQRNELVK